MNISPHPLSNPDGLPTFVVDTIREQLNDTFPDHRVHVSDTPHGATVSLMDTDDVIPFAAELWFSNNASTVTAFILHRDPKGTTDKAEFHLLPGEGCGDNPGPGSVIGYVTTKAGAILSSPAVAA